MKDEFVGICYGFGGTQGATCKVIPRAGDLEVRIEGVTVGSLPYVGIRVSSTGVDDRYLCFEADVSGLSARVLVPDKEIVDQILALGAPRSVVDQVQRLKSARSKRKMGRVGLLLSVVVVVAALAGFVWLGFGWAVSKAVRAIPVEWEVELGKSTAADILAQSQICSDPDLNRAMAEIGFRLVGGLGMTPYAFKLRVIDSEEVNAFALPGGYVFVNRGLIESSEDGAEVAGVLAHEIQHVLHRHGLQNLVRQAGLMLAVTMLFGDAGQMEQFLMYNAAGLASMSFSRDQELVADSDGLSLMYRSYIDATGLPRFLKKLSQEEVNLGGVLTLLSTHPASDDRVDRLHRTIAAWPAQQVTPITPNWASIKTLCSPGQISDPDGP